MCLSAVILAAGKGSRMKSNVPKVLHNLAGKPMVKHVIDTCYELNISNISLIYGHEKEKMKKALHDEKVNWVLQEEQNGTGHAVDMASPNIGDDDKVLILYGDVPLIQISTLQNLLENYPEDGIGLLTVMLDDPTGYGRILRTNGEISAIREEKDATEDEKLIQEVNTGIMVAKGKDLKNWLSKLDNNNAQKEYYLTDIIALAKNEGRSIIASHPENEMEVQGANDRAQLADLEREYQFNRASELLEQGVTILDPYRFDLRGELQVGLDVEIDINVIIKGKVTIGNNVKIGAGVILNNCVIEDNSLVEAYSIIDDSIVNENCTIGPFARIRPGTHLHDDVKIGNFVETKNTVLGKGSKANHLTYLGDSEIGENTNIGAGVITCNYDGVNKHKTQIGDNVFVGSDSQLVAPIKIENGATIGAGTTLTKNVNTESLVITRSPIKEVKNWKRPVKK